MNFEEIRDIIERLTEDFKRVFGDNLKALILYGSWVKGTARENSDVDLLAIFENPEKGISRKIDDIVYKINTERTISITPAILEDFKKEKIPLYTAVKREGKVLYGDIDLIINQDPPHIKYSEFFEESEKFEKEKLKISEEPPIQASLAMFGEGYSSKIQILLPLAKTYQ